MPCLYTLNLDKEYNFNTHEEYNNFLRDNIGLINKYIAEKENAASSTNDKIYHVNYEISEETRNDYRRSNQDAIGKILGNRNVLLFKPNTRSTFVPISEFNDFAGISEYYNIPDTSNRGIYGNSTEELFTALQTGEGVKRSLLLQMGLRIAARFTNETDKFTGRLQSTVQGNKSIRIVDEENSQMLYSDGKGIYINIGKLGKLVNSFNNYEAFIKGVDLIFTEELIHNVFQKISIDKDLFNVYNELSTKQKNDIKKIYRDIDDSTDSGKFSLVNEYLRMLVQDVMLGTTTEYELKPAVKKLIAKFLDFIKKAFVKKPSLKSKNLIDRFEYFYTTGKVSIEHLMFDDKTKNILKNTKLGVNLESEQKELYKANIKYSKLSKHESLSKLPETKLDRYTQLFEEHLAQLQSKFPNIKVNVVESNNSELGWVDKGEVFINNNKFTLATPIHEFAHVYLAIIKDTNYDKYLDIINSVEGLPYYKEIRTAYSDLKSVEDIKEETFVYLLGEQFADRLLNSKDTDYEISVKDKIIRTINNFLKDIAEVLGLSSILNLQNTDKYIQQVTNEILDSSTPVTLPSEALASLINDVKYQKSLVISNVNDLLKFISGKGLNVNEDSVRHTVGNITSKYDGKDFFYLSKEDEKSGTAKKSFMGLTDINDRKKLVEVALRDKLDADRSTDMNNIVNFYKLSKEERLDILSSTNKEDKYYYTVVDKLFEYFREGDKVVSYSDLKNTNPEFYSAELDNKNTVVHVGSNQKFTVINITNLGVRNGEKEETIFGGLAGKSTLAGASNVNTSNSNQDLNSLQATLISMFITKNGGKVQKVGVGKFDKKVFANTPVTTDTAKELKTLKYLRKINAVNEQLSQTKDLKSILLDTLEDDKLFSSISYQSSYLQLLKDTYEDFNTENYTYPAGLREELDNYITSPKDISHIEKLRNTIKRRLEYLSRELSDADQKQSKEFILLSESLRSIDSGYEHTLNAHKNLGSIEKWYTSFLSVSNKYVAWWLKGFESRRFNLTEKWLKDYKGYNGKVNEKGGMLDVFEALIKDYEVRNPTAVLTSRVLNDTTKYFDNLYVYKEVNYTDKNGNTTKVKVNTFKLKPETDKDLTKAEKDTIAYIKKHVKDTVIANYKLNNPKPQDKTGIEWEEAIEEWYNKSSFGLGAIPIVKSTVSSKLFNTGETSLTGVASKKLLDNFLNLNTYYENKPEDFTKIPDYFSYQTSNELFNEKVGLDFNGDYVIDGWEALQADVETDIVKALDIFTLQNYKQEFMKELIPMWKAATAMINKMDIDLGIKQLGEDAIKSNTEDVLDKIVKSLLFGQKITAKTAGEQKLAKFIDVVTTATTFGTVALAPFTSLKSFLSNVAALITNAMKNNPEYKYSLEDLYWAFKSMTKEFDKAVMLATELRVFNADEFDMVTSLQYSAHKFSLLRSVNAFILDLGADRFIKLMILLAQSKKDKTWGAYKWDKDKLVYDEAADRRNRGDKVVDEIKLNQQKEKSLHPNAKMKSAYDSGSRLVYEKLNATVLGGYTDLTATTASTTFLGKAFSQMRKYMFVRTEKAFRDEEYNDNEVYYKQDKNGEVVRITPYENGQYKSFVRMASIFYNKYFGLTSEQISDMTPSDRENLKSMLVFTLSAVGFMVMQAAFEDDDEKSKKTRSVYDSLISDMFIIDNAKTTIDAFKNPFISISFISKLMDITKDIVVGDLKDANNKLFKTVGVLKTYDFFTTLGK
jgi:hypothetical protein